MGTQNQTHQARIYKSRVRLALLLLGTFPVLLGAQAVSPQAPSTINLNQATTQQETTSQVSHANVGSPVSDNHTGRRLFGDTDFMAGTVQAVATVCAVFMGYLLSLIAERRAWNRRKMEQVREKQLAALLLFLSIMQDLLEFADRIAPEIGSTAKTLSELQVGVGRSAARDAARTSLSGRAAEWLRQIQEGKRAAVLRVMELRMLRFGMDGLARVDDCMGCVHSLLNVITRMHADPQAAGQGDFGSEVEALGKRTDALIGSALESLNG